MTRNYRQQPGDDPMSNKVLIVDDDEAFRRLLTEILQGQYELSIASSGEEALRMASRFGPDLVLLDIMMPGIDGYETCRRLKLDPRTADIRIVMISAKSSEAEQLQALTMGADDYLVKPIDPNELRSRVRLYCRVRDLMGKVASLEAETGSHAAAIKQLAEERETDIIATQDVTVFTLAKVAESRDAETGEHLLRMRSYSQSIAEHLSREGPYAEQIDQQFLDNLYRSSPLHDIGKVGISDAILLKPGLLTPEQSEIIKQHTIIGANILDQAVTRSPSGSFLAMAVSIARFHHERFDGTGYLEGLAGGDIPLPARIVAVADVFDALTSVRPYKPAYGIETAREIIEDGSGTHFDPVIVDAFDACFEECVGVCELYGSDTSERAETVPPGGQELDAATEPDIRTW